MKTLTKSLIVFLFIGIVFTACKDDDDDNGGNGTLTATVDGTSWSASLSVVATNTNNLVTVTGSDSGGKQLQFAVHNVTATGSYNLGGTMTNQNYGRWTAGISADQTYTNMMGQGSGTVEFTELSASEAKGTFSFTANNTSGATVNVTNGSFSVKFQ